MWIRGFFYYKEDDSDDNIHINISKEEENINKVSAEKME